MVDNIYKESKAIFLKKSKAIYVFVCGGYAFVFSWINKCSALISLNKKEIYCLQKWTISYIVF